MYSVQCTVYSVQCTANSVQCTAYGVQERRDKDKGIKYQLFRIRMFIFSIEQEAETRSTENMKCLQYFSLPTVTRLLDIRGKQDAITDTNQYADLEDADKEDSGL